MKASVEEYNSENGYGSENVDVWTIFQGLSQNKFRAAHLAPELEGFLFKQYGSRQYSAGRTDNSFGGPQLNS